MCPFNESITEFFVKDFFFRKDYQPVVQEKEDNSCYSEKPRVGTNGDTEPYKKIAQVYWMSDYGIHSRSI